MPAHPAPGGEPRYSLRGALAAFRFVRPIFSGSMIEEDTMREDPLQRDPYYWERREVAVKQHSDCTAFRPINLARWEGADFWDLFSGEMDCSITSQPVEDVIPLLRCLIDKCRLASDEDPYGREMAGAYVQETEYRIECLLYYAWDRAREVR